MVPAGEVWHTSKRIPVRNLWLLMFYASELRHLGAGRIGTERQPDELPDLVAEILCREVERRLQQNLTQGYVDEQAIRSRVRGQVDMLKSERAGLFRRGQVACRYQELTMDTPRNRYVRDALRHLATLALNRGLRRRCRTLAARLEKTGVTGRPPKTREVASERYGRHDQHDRPMVAGARLAFELKIPTEQGDREILLRPSHEEQWLRHLFEKAVAGFYDVVLGEEWSVKTGMQQAWPVEAGSAGLQRILPGMVTDIFLRHKASQRRIVIDTKFATILTGNAYGQDKLKSEYLYQMYAYLRTQERSDDPGSLSTEGLLLHPAAGTSVDEEVTVQGHRIRFATVDLAAETGCMRSELLKRVAAEPTDPA